MHWKIERDSYYNSLYKEFGEKFIVEAGFFYDNYQENVDFKESKNIICTHIPDGINENSVILFTCGAFCPYHEGHLDMMFYAKSAIESRGKSVVAGYISPSHDEYVLNKVPESYNINERISLIEEKIKQYDWLFVDPWEGIFTKYSINFTDVIERLEEYVLFHTGFKVPIYFVCGSDNAKFALTFINKGYCIVVKRPGYDFEDYQKRIVTDRVLWVEGNNTESSSNIRKRGIIKQEKKNVYIRKENFHPLENDLIKALKSSFNRVEVDDYNEQLQIFENIKPKDANKKTLPIVSLDRLIKGDVNFKLSRKYSSFGIRKLGYYNRGFSEKLDFEECYLFDDDVFTGGTIKFASNILEKNRIKTKAVFTFKIGNDIEIIDCRDFLIGHPEGGMFVKLPNGEISRVPYIFPFICPYLRASVMKPMELSINVWELNLAYFKTNPLIKVKDIESMRNALICSGFDDDDNMETVCNYYITFLKNLKNEWTN